MSEGRKRNELPPRERAVNDTLDEYLARLHGIISSWAYPVEFLEFLEKRGYTVIEKECVK